MKILITYYSLTGNTAKVAHAIYEAVIALGYEATLSKLSNISAADMSSYDLVFLGSACHDTDLAKPAKRLLENIDESPTLKLAGFVTHATHMPEKDERARALYEQWAGNCIRTFQRISEEKQIAFLGYFHCQGAPSPPIETFIHTTIITDSQEWAEYSADMHEHPNEAALEKARVFARRVLDKCEC